MKPLIIAAAVIALALSPSIKECVQAHRDGDPHRFLIFGWAALVVILAFVAGEEILGGGIA